MDISVNIIIIISIELYKHINKLINQCLPAMRSVSI